MAIDHSLSKPEENKTHTQNKQANNNNNKIAIVFFFFFPYFFIWKPTFCSHPLTSTQKVQLSLSVCLCSLLMGCLDMKSTVEV